MKKSELIFQKSLWLALAWLSLGSMAQTKAAPVVAVWDTRSALAENAHLDNRTGWKPVPLDLLTLEADPLKASSDPGYYGRDYVLQGDLVIESPSLTAVFWSAKGRLVIYSKRGPEARQVVEIRPAGAAPSRLLHCELLEDGADQVLVEATFSGGRSARFAFDKSGIVEVKPGSGMSQMHLSSPIQYGVLPSFIGDDLIYAASDYSSSSKITLPPENLLLGLVEGEGDILVMTWPKGKRALSLTLGKSANGSSRFDGIDFDSGGQSFYLAGLSGPGIWHREELRPDYLEKDIAIHWKRPFPAKWKTELLEENVRTTYAFRESKGHIWRGVAGSYEYPAWFEGGEAFFHLSKKVPPAGESVIYFVEGRNTPPSILTPADIMKSALGRAQADPILDLAGRKLRTHHRRGAAGVRRACTCGCTEAIQAIFEAGEENAKADQVDQEVDDMIYFVQRHVARISEYQHFADGMLSWLKAQPSSTPELKTFIDNLTQIVEQIPAEDNVQKENMKSLEYAEDLRRQTEALARRKAPQNLAAYMELLKAWRGMGGAQDYVLAQCNVITRNLFQAAGYGCATEPRAVELAGHVRTSCRAILRNPDGYELWPNY